jgi:hypothetical protein
MLDAFLRRHANEPFVGLNHYRHLVRVPQAQAQAA